MTEADKLQRRVKKLIKELHEKPNGHKFITVWDLEERLKVNASK